jgi:hypothetical protein
LLVTSASCSAPTTSPCSWSTTRARTATPASRPEPPRLGDFFAWVDSLLYMGAPPRTAPPTVEHRGAPAPEPLGLDPRWRRRRAPRCRRVVRERFHRERLHRARQRRRPRAGRARGARRRPLSRADLPASARSSRARCATIHDSYEGHLFVFVGKAKDKVTHAHRMEGAGAGWRFAAVGRSWSRCGQHRAAHPPYFRRRIGCAPGSLR